MFKKKSSTKGPKPDKRPDKRPVEGQILESKKIQTSVRQNSSVWNNEKINKSLLPPPQLSKNKTQPRNPMRFFSRSSVIKPNNNQPDFTLEQAKANIKAQRLFEERINAQNSKKKNGTETLKPALDSRLKVATHNLGGTFLGRQKEALKSILSSKISS